MTDTAWTLPQTQGASVGEAFVTTGPSGLLLGRGESGPVTVRLFRPQPTRVLLAVPEYVTWLVAFRCLSLGAHVSIVADDRRRWQVLIDAMIAAGGTCDLVARGALPSQGRPYRPSLVVDDTGADAGTIAPGAWQCVASLRDVSASEAIHHLRTADIALASPCGTRVTENLRRAYVLNARQTKLCNNLESNELVAAMPRRLVRVVVPPTPIEYAAMFGR